LFEVTENVIILEGDLDQLVKTLVNLEAGVVFRDTLSNLI